MEQFGYVLRSLHDIVQVGRQTDAQTQLWYRPHCVLLVTENDR